MLVKSLSVSLLLITFYADFNNNTLFAVYFFGNIIIEFSLITTIMCNLLV